MSKLAGIFAATGVALGVLPGPAEAHEHDLAARALGMQLAEGTKPSATCLAERQACISAGTQAGANGVRYVPPDVAGQCHEAYSAGINRR